MNIHTAESLRNNRDVKGLVRYDIHLDLGKLPVRAKTAITLALRTGVYPAGHGIGTTVYEELLRLAQLPGIQLTKSPIYGWRITMHNPSAALHAALRQIWDLDVVSSALEQVPQHQHRRGSPNSGPYPYARITSIAFITLTSQAVKHVHHFREFLKPVVSDPGYRQVAEFLVAKVMTGETVKFST